MLIDDHWDVWHLSTCHRGVICTLLQSILCGKTRCLVLIRPAVMFLMTSSPLQATEEFSDLPPVTPVCSLSQTQMWVLTHLNPPKTFIERERAFVCVRAHKHMNDSRKQSFAEEQLMCPLFIYHVYFIMGIWARIVKYVEFLFYKVEKLGHHSWWRICCVLLK